MKRDRSIPWIHRLCYSIAEIASVGAAITGYLAIIKLTGSTACPTNGCDLV